MCLRQADDLARQSDESYPWTFPDTARELHWHDFGPRLGISQMLQDKTVIRAGYGLVRIEQTAIGGQSFGALSYETSQRSNATR